MAAKRKDKNAFDVEVRTCKHCGKKFTMLKSSSKTECSENCYQQRKQQVVLQCSYSDLFCGMGGSAQYNPLG